MADTTLAADLTADAVLMTVAVALSASREGDILCQIDSEFVLIERRGMLTNPQIRRGMYGSVRASHSSAADVTIVLPQVQTSVSAAQVPVDVHGVAAGYKLARGETALDGTNPTPVAHGLTTCVAFTATLKGTAAPGVGTHVLTANINGANVDVYAWKPTSNADPTLVASTGTESFYWTAIGT